MNEDFITGRAYDELKDLSMNISLRSKIGSNDALLILTKIGFYEERYGPKPYVIENIIELSNKGYSPSHIFAAIKLLPINRQNEIMEIGEDVIKTADKVLRNENITYDKFKNDKRAIDL